MGERGGEPPQFTQPRCHMSSLLLLVALACSQEVIGFPRGVITPKEQIGHSESVVQRGSDRRETASPIGVLDLEDPRLALRFDRDPACLSGCPVVVPHNAAMSHNVVKGTQNLSVDRGQVRRPVLGAMFPRLRFLHDLRQGGKDGSGKTIPPVVPPEKCRPIAE